MGALRASTGYIRICAKIKKGVVRIQLRAERASRIDEYLVFNNCTAAAAPLICQRLLCNSRTASGRPARSLARTQFTYCDKVAHLVERVPHGKLQLALADSCGKRNLHLDEMLFRRGGRSHSCSWTGGATLCGGRPQTTVQRAESRSAGTTKKLATCTCLMSFSSLTRSYFPPHLPVRRRALARHRLQSRRQLLVDSSEAAVGKNRHHIPADAFPERWFRRSASASASSRARRPFFWISAASSGNSSRSFSGTASERKTPATTTSSANARLRAKSLCNTRRRRVFDRGSRIAHNRAPA